MYKIDREGTDPYTAQLEYSTGNPKGKYYGVDNDQNLLIAFIAYIEPETGIGPEYNEIIYDRAIVFHKTPVEAE